MGETIRYLMVAAIIVGSVAGVRPKPIASAQGPSGQGSGAMELPSSLSPSLTNAVSSAFGKSPSSTSAQTQNSGNTASNAYPTNASSSKNYPGLATARPGGPTTDPNAPRDNSWMTGTTATTGTRPTTDPWSLDSKTPSTAPSNSLSEKLRKSLPGAGNTASGSQPTGAANNGRASTPTNSSGFATLPGGVNLPERNPPQNVPGPTSGFASSPTGQGGSPIGGNATTANGFDPSAYNTNRNASPGSARQVPTQPTAQNQLGYPGSTAGSPQGLPSATAAGSGVPTNWTREQIIALGAKFGVPANDPRLNDRAFMNDLYTRWQAYEAKQRAAGLAVAGTRPASDTPLNSPLGASNPASSWGNTVPGASNRSQIAMGQLGAKNQLSPTASRSNLATSGPNLLPPSNRPIPSRNPPLPSARRKPLYDSFGNRVDVDGNILDERGHPVDAATEYQLTVGKKLREDMDRIARERAELERKKKEQEYRSSSDRVATLPASTFGLPPGIDTQLAMSGSGSGRRGTVPSMRTQVKRPPSTEKDLGSDGKDDHLSADQAGIGGAATAIGRSNPYINVFLLSSLVANAFLFLWLHRLWHHHRELIAASRMAASGISTSE